MARKQEIEAAYGIACGAYSRPTYPNELEAWQTYLAEFGADDIRAVVLPLTDKYPGKMPTLGVVRSEIIGRVKRRENAKRERAKPEPYLDPKLALDNPFRLLAEKWEAESKALGLDPDQPSPPDIASRRSRGLNELMAKQW